MGLRHSVVNVIKPFLFVTDIPGDTTTILIKTLLITTLLITTLLITLINLTLLINDFTNK